MENVNYNRLCLWKWQRNERVSGAWWKNPRLPEIHYRLPRDSNKALSVLKSSFWLSDWEFLCVCVHFVNLLQTTFWSLSPVHSRPTSQRNPSAVYNYETTFLFHHVLQKGPPSEGGLYNLNRAYSFWSTGPVSKRLQISNLPLRNNVIQGSWYVWVCVNIYYV